MHLTRTNKLRQARDQPTHSLTTLACLPTPPVEMQLARTSKMSQTRVQTRGAYMPQESRKFGYRKALLAVGNACWKPLRPLPMAGRHGLLYLISYKSRKPLQRLRVEALACKLRNAPAPKLPRLGGRRQDSWRLSQGKDQNRTRSSQRATRMRLPPSTTEFQKTLPVRFQVRTAKRRSLASTWRLLAYVKNNCGSLQLKWSQNGGVLGCWCPDGEAGVKQSPNFVSPRVA